MTIANVQDADAGGITVNVSDNFSDSGSSSATLHVIDPPSSPNVTQSQNTPPVSAGSVDILTATANGTKPFTYQWFLGTNQILGATGSNLNVNVSGSAAGTYSVVISNPPGSVTNNMTGQSLRSAWFPTRLFLNRLITRSRPTIPPRRSRRGALSV